jgi:hypothetical protein
MKNLFKIVLLFGGITVLSACSDDLLDTQPRQSLTPEVALADVPGYQALLNSAYGKLRNFSYYGQQMIIAPDVMADNLRIIANTGRYIGQESNADRAHIGLWYTAFWTGINEVNVIIAGVDAAAGADADKAQIKAQALFLRALFYHDLAKVYGYEPGKEVGGWNKAVILRTTPTLGFSDADFRERATNAEVYTQIEKDLQAAIAILPVGSIGSSGIYKATKGAAQALLARVYLYAGRNSDAATMATNAMTSFGLTDTGTGLLTTTNYITAFSTAPNPESLFELEQRSVDWSSVDGVNNSVSSLVSNVGTSAQFILTATDDLISKYESGDVRRTAWVTTTRTGASGNVYKNEKWKGHKGDFLQNIAILRGSELYLIRAEARYKLANEAGAIADLNALRSKRGLANLSSTLTGTDLFNKIMDERRVEFALEGHRWFDLKRNGMTITKGAGFTAVPYTDYRILAPIPQAELQLNSKLVNNPNYK